MSRKISHESSELLAAAVLETLENRRLLSGSTFAQYAEPVKIADINASVIADFDGDGLLDVAADGNVRFGIAGGLLGDVTANYYDTAGDVFMIAAGDTDGDGRAELIALADGHIQVVDFKGRTATLSSSQYVGRNADNLALGDFNGDGHLDVAFDDYRESTEGEYAHTQYLAFAWNDGEGAFSSVDRRQVRSAVDPSSAAVVDLDGDGRDELLRARWFDGTTVVSALFEVQANEKLQTRTAESASPLGGTVVGLDSNGDGTKNIALALRNIDDESILYVWKANGDTLERSAGTVIPGNGDLVGFTALYDQSAAQPVIVLAGDNGSIDIYTLPATNGATGAAVASIDTSDDPAVRVTAHDLDGDGHADLVLSSAGGSYAAKASGIMMPDAPEASFTITGKRIEGEQLTFSAAGSTGSDLRYAWGFGATGFAVGESATHTFNTAGTYTVRLMVTDGLQRTSTTTQSITIAVAPLSQPAEPKVVPPTFPDIVPLNTMRTFKLPVATGLGDAADEATFVIDWHDGTSNNGRINAQGQVVVTRAFTARGEQPYTLLVKDSQGAEYVSTGVFTVGTDDQTGADSVQRTQGTVIVHGTGGDDKIELFPIGSNDVAIFVNGEAQGVFNVRNIQVHGGAGDDLIDLSRLEKTHYASSIIWAGHGNDTVIGGAGRDTIYGMDGDDRLDGGAGDDVLEGSAGNDHMIGGRGNDTLIGGRGGADVADYSANTQFQPIDVTLDDQANDRDGLGGIDHVATGTEFVLGGAGNDRIIGDSYNNYLNGGDGDDILWGGAGNDHLEGGSGNNTLNGGDGDDILVSFGGVLRPDPSARNLLIASAGSDRAVVGPRDVIDQTNGVLDQLFDSEFDLFSLAA